MPRTVLRRRPGSIQSTGHRVDRAIARCRAHLPHLPAQLDGLDVRRPERRRETEEGTPIAKEIERGHVPGQHRGVAPRRAVQADEYAQESLRDGGDQGSSQDQGVTGRALTHDQGTRSLGLSERGSFPHPDHVVACQEPPFHGEAG